MSWGFSLPLTPRTVIESISLSHPHLNKIAISEACLKNVFNLIVLLRDCCFKLLGPFPFLWLIFDENKAKLPKALPPRSELNSVDFTKKRCLLKQNCFAVNPGTIFLFLILLHAFHFFLDLVEEFQAFWRSL